MGQYASAHTPMHTLTSNMGKTMHGFKHERKTVSACSQQQIHAESNHLQVGGYMVADTCKQI